MLNNIKLKTNRQFAKTKLTMKKHAPEILLGAGVAGVIISTVMACVATTKAERTIAEGKERLAVIHNLAEESSDYTESEIKEDIAKVYLQTGVKVVGLYLSAATLQMMSLGCIFKGHSILKNRNLALAGAYQILDASFKSYRERIAERLGEEEERNIRYNIVKKDVESEYTDENGKTKKKKKKQDVVNDESVLTSPFSKFFDETCEAWQTHPEYNLSFLRAQQNMANDKLRAQGYLFLNDVYDALGIERTSQGQIFGWVYDYEKDDTFVDFGIYNTYKESNRRFVNGLENVILLDFNVQGDILNKIDHISKYGKR